MNWCWNCREELPAWKQPCSVHLSTSAREVELHSLLGWGLGKIVFGTALAASVANKGFVVLTWAILSGDWGNCQASLRYLGKSVNKVNSDNANTKLIEMVRKA